MTKDVQDAIAILHSCLFKLDGDEVPSGEGNGEGNVILLHAIRHLAYPDRDVYPKVRHATKSKPVRSA